MKTVKAKVGVSLFALSLGLLSTTPAIAQSTTSPEPAAGTKNTDGVADIVVTAQRRDESLQKVPVSVTPVTGADLQLRKLNDLVQISLAVPSLSIGSDNAFSLRGVGSQIFTPNIDSSVGVMVNDVSLGVPIFMSNGILDDVKSVEVLTGPQGLLFGRNSSAGLVNVISNRPELGRTSGSANVEYDNRDTAPGGHFGIVARATLNLPVSVNSALRVNMLESYQDPIVKNVNSSNGRSDDFQQRAAVNARYLNESITGLSIYVIGDYSRERGIGGIWDRSWRSVAPGGLEAANVAGDGLVPGPDLMQFGARGENYRSVDTYGLSLNLKHDLADGITLNNIAAWRAYKLSYNLDSSYGGLDLLRVNQAHHNYNQYSDELRLALNRNELIDGQVGLYFFESNLAVQSSFLGAGAPATGPNGIFGFIDGTNDYTQDSTSLAAFGQFNVHPTEQLTLLAGGRVTYDRVVLHAVSGNVPGAANIVNLDGINGTFNPPANKHTNFSYKVGAQYQFTPAVMGYLTWGTGYKGPSFNTTLAFVGQDLAIRPETATNLEGGLKASFFDHKLRLNISAFLENYKDFQVQAFNAAGGQFVTENAATVRSKGIEVNGSARPVQALTLNFGATLQDSKFTDFPGDQCAPGLVGCTGSFNGAGVATPTSAHFTSTVDAKYNISVGGLKGLYIESNWYHRSSVNFKASGSPLTAIGPVDLFGASIGISLNKQIDLAVFCKNCTDQRVPSYLDFDPLDSAIFNKASVAQTFDYNSVRTIGASVNFRF